MLTGHSLERAKEVLSFHACQLWRSTSSDDFEFVCGRIWLIADNVAQKLGLSDVSTELSETDSLYNERSESESDMLQDNSSCEQNFFPQEHRLFYPCTGFRDLSNIDQVTRSKSRAIHKPETDKVIRPPVQLNVGGDHHPLRYFNVAKTAILYDNPFDHRLFEGFSRALKFCLAGSRSTLRDTNIFLDKRDMTQLIENNLLGYRLFIMIPALTPCDSSWEFKDKAFLGCDVKPLPRFSETSDLASFFSSWQCLSDIMDIPRDILDKWDGYKLEDIWFSDVTPSPTASLETDITCRIPPPLAYRTHYVDTEPIDLAEATTTPFRHAVPDPRSRSESLCTAVVSSSDELSDYSPDCHTVQSTVKPCSKARSLDSDFRSPCRKVKRLFTDKDIMEESGYLSSQQIRGAGDTEPRRCIASEEEELLKAAKSAAPMNPLAEPFIFKRSPSCEECIMADQLLVNKSFGIDEPLEDQYCSTFFPPLAMSTPNMTKSNRGPQLQDRNNYRSVLESSKSFTQSIHQPAGVYLQSSSQPDNSRQLPVNVSTGRPSQHMFVSPVAPPTVPPSNQQPPLFINTAVPPRCTWVQTPSVLLRPVHSVNQSGLMPTPMLSHNLPQAQTQLLVQGPRQIPLYMVQSQSNRTPAPPPHTTNQQYSNVCRPILTNSFVPTQNPQQNSDHIASQSICSSTQKELIKSALELMKCRPTTVSRIQHTASRQ